MRKDLGTRAFDSRVSVGRRCALNGVHDGDIYMSFWRGRKAVGREDKSIWERVSDGSVGRFLFGMWFFFVSGLRQKVSCGWIRCRKVKKKKRASHPTLP